MSELWRLLAILLVKIFYPTGVIPTDMLHYKGEQLDRLEVQSQKNMGKFMKILVTVHGYFCRIGQHTQYQIPIS